MQAIPIRNEGAVHGPPLRFGHHCSLTTLSGFGRIIDLGPVSIDDDSELPAEGFNIFLVPEEIIPGNTYLIRLADGAQFGKIYIVNFDVDNELLDFI